MSASGARPPASDSRRLLLASGAGVLLGAGAGAAAGALTGRTGPAPVQVISRPAGTSRIVDVHDHLDESLPAGAARDTAAWQAALAAAAVPEDGVDPAEHHAVVTAPGGSFVVDETLSWDARVSIDGHCEIRYTGSGPALQTVGPVLQSSAAGYTRQHQTVLSNLHLIGDGSNTGIAVSAPSHLREPGPKPAYLSFANVVARSFDTAVELGSHAYLLEFRSCSFQGNRVGVVAVSDAVDSGERIALQGCDLTSNTESALQIHGDQEFFVDQCSFDTFSTNQGRAVTISRGQAHFSHCHFEMQIPDNHGWFELDGWGALLSLTDCRFLIRARKEVDSDAERGLIQFSGAGGQRAVVRGGQFQGGSSRLPFLARGDGELTVSDTSALPSTALRFHAAERIRGVLDPHGSRSVLADDWTAEGGASVAPGDSPVAGLRALALEDGSGSGAVHLFVPIATGARVLASLDALYEGSGSVSIDLGFSTARRADGLGRDWYSATDVSARDSFAGVRLDDAYSLPAPEWAVCAVLRVRTDGMAASDRLHLRDLRVSRL
jgi:hypothetical protein